MPTPVMKPAMLAMLKVLLRNSSGARMGERVRVCHQPKRPSAVAARRRSPIMSGEAQG